MSKANWQGGMAFDLELQGRNITVDASENFGGKDLGPQPKGLMLSALAGCTGMDVVSVLGKKRVPFSAFSIDIEAENADSHPMVYTSILIQYRFEGDDDALDPKKILRSIELSLNDYCAVANTLRHCAEIRFELYTNGKKTAEGKQGESKKPS